MVSAGRIRMYSGKWSPMRRILQVSAVKWTLMILVLVVGPSVALAQWLGYPTPGIPRLANGAPNMKARAPRTRDGKPDFSGIWFANVPAKDYCRETDCVQEEVRA